MPKRNIKEEYKTVRREIKKGEFRVAIFGSARIKPKSKFYRDVYELAREVGRYGFDLVTGGGPGLMEAANNGHAEGDKEHKTDNIGLTIKLPWEIAPNRHLEIKKKFNRFSNRLDHFMALSRALVIMPGGVGTSLEFFYSWQLIQVKHVQPIPIILVGTMWEKLIDWVKKYPLRAGFISPKDMKHIFIAKNHKEAMKLIMKAYKTFKEKKKTRKLFKYF